MLIAENQLGHCVIATEVEKISKERFVCPGCKQAVVLKKGRVKIPHFAHRRAACDSFSEGETREHLHNKALMQRWSGGQLEAYLPELQQRPDVLWRRVAIEVQCSRLSLERLVERVVNYRKHGYVSWWLLGQQFVPKKHWHKLQQGCSYFSEKLGTHLWTIQQGEIVLYYHVQQHFRYGCLYRKHIWNQQHQLPEILEFQSDQTVSVNWQSEDYQQYIQLKVIQKDPTILTLQAQLYQQHLVIQQLEEWCYAPSAYFFYFQHRILYLRAVFVQTNHFIAWLSELKRLDYTWGCPLVNQKQILVAVYQECQQLAKEFSK